MTGSVERFRAEAFATAGLGVSVQRPRLGAVPVHWHDFYELGLVRSGEAEHVVNGEVRRLGPGSAFLLSPADFHAIRPVGDAPLECWNAVLAADLVERQLGRLGWAAVADLPWLVEDAASLGEDLAGLWRETQVPEALGAPALVEGLVTCVVVRLARRTGAAGPRGPSVDADLRAAVAYVDRHFREPLTLASAAAVAHLSPNYFSERFAQVTGTSFQSYLQDRRLRFARSLLAATPLSVTEVCHAAGFGTVSHFGRAYRRRYGVAPSAHRAVGGVAIEGPESVLGVTETTPIH